MRKITFILFMLVSINFYAQCPIPATSFVGDYNITQVTSNNTFLDVPSFNTQVVSLTVGASTNAREFSALYAEDLGVPDQTPTVVSFTLDCPNGSDVIVDAGINTFLACGPGIPSITLGPAATTGVFDENDDSSFTLILEEFETLGGCMTTPRTVEFTLTKASCAAPQMVSVSNITNTTADVSWTNPNGGGTTFDVEYGIQGFALGTGTTISGISGLSTQMTNLQQGNFYDVYVTSNCGSDSSIPAGPIEFLVPSDCASIYSGFPFVEDFGSSADFASCYTVIDEDANGTGWIQQELELSPGNVQTFSTNGLNASTKEDYLFTPAFSLTAGNTYDFTFRFNGADAANGLANEDLEVLVAQGTTVADANAGTSIFTQTGIVQTGAFADVESQASTGSGSFTPNVTGDYHFVFKSTGSPLAGAATTGFLLVFDYNLDETLSTDVFETSNFDYFVDSRNTLNLSANQAIDNVSLHNLLGQNVISQKLGSNNESIDLNSLTSGVYLTKVQINGSSKTFKIIVK